MYKTDLFFALPLQKKYLISQCANVAQIALFSINHGNRDPNLSSRLGRVFRTKVHCDNPTTTANDHSPWYQIMLSWKHCRPILIFMVISKFYLFFLPSMHAIINYYFIRVTMKNYVVFVFVFVLFLFFVFLLLFLFSLSVILRLQSWDS